MRIVLTGSSGRVGRAIYSTLSSEHDVIGMDRSPFSTTHVVGDFADQAPMRSALEGADAVIHVAALHAPHVGTVPDEEFRRINMAGTRLLAETAIRSGVRRFVFTSTTALYGHAVSGDACTWINEETRPQPRSIYHRTKIEAEGILKELAGPEFAVRVLRMSRCFPEQADIMAAYRLHRGVDARDVADAHVLALTNMGSHFQRYIISGTTPFEHEDCDQLVTDAASVIRRRAPFLAIEFDRRGWKLPNSIDRVYDPAQAAVGLGWTPQFGGDEIFEQLDRRSLEVLPPGVRTAAKAE